MLVHMELSEAIAIAGTLGKPSKMPGYSYGLPAARAAWVPEYAARHGDNVPQYGCPVGAKLASIKGTTCAACYAVKGNYTFKHVREAQYKRLRGVSHPRWVDAMVELIYMNVDAKQPYFRWHDSGDLLSLDHLTKIVEVCRRTKYVRHWLPTREARIVADWREKYGEFPGNLTVRLSATRIDGPPPASWPITSTVNSERQPVGHVCPAPTQGNNCGQCRACWDKRVRNVSYYKH